jgi:hypothetical protein
MYNMDGTDDFMPFFSGKGGDNRYASAGNPPPALDPTPLAMLQPKGPIQKKTSSPSTSPGSAIAASSTVKSGADVIPDDLFGGAGAPGWMGSQGDLFQQLMDEYGKVDSAFDTSAFDKASETEYSNILSQGESSSNAAAADYAARARQAGGSAEGAGVIKAQGLVGARSQVADFRMKQLQFDIQQKEAARQLASEIAAHLGSLRMDYLKNLTGWNESQAQLSSAKWIAQFEGKNRIDVANIDAATKYAGINEQSREFNWLHPFHPGASNIWNMPYSPSATAYNYPGMTLSMASG